MRSISVVLSEMSQSGPKFQGCCSVAEAAIYARGVKGEISLQRINGVSRNACKLKSPMFHASPHHKTLWWQIICLPLLLSMWHSSLLPPSSFSLLLSYYGHSNRVAVRTTKGLIHRLSLSQCARVCVLDSR